MRDAILRGQLPTHFMQKLDEICDPCRRQVSLDEIMLLFPLPDLTSGGLILIKSDLIGFSNYRVKFDVNIFKFQEKCAS